MCISFCDFVCWVWHLCASVFVIFCVGFGTCAFQFYDFLCWFWHLCVSAFVIFCVGFGTCVYQFLCIIVCACVGVSGKVQYQFSVEGIALNIFMYQHFWYSIQLILFKQCVVFFMPVSIHTVAIPFA